MMWDRENYALTLSFSGFVDVLFFAEAVAFPK